VHPFIYLLQIEGKKIHISLSYIHSRAFYKELLENVGRLEILDMSKD
jgi:hypothetical protein